MWTPFLLNDGKPNSAGYGFAWAIGKVNDHKVIQHSGAWQGFTAQISRYVDDGLTVVVLTNLDAGHARPAYIEHTVSGIVLPALMPKPLVPIADAEPAIAAKTRRMLAASYAGADLTPEFDAKSSYTFEPDDSADFRASLPAAWSTSPLVLVKRRVDDNGVTNSAFRLGPPGDTRVITLSVDKVGKAKSFQVLPDPDAR